MLHVRDLISHLNYDGLVRTNYIPDLASYLTNLESKRYPRFVYRDKNFSFFGMCMDYWVRKGLRKIPEASIDLGTDQNVSSNDLSIYHSNVPFNQSVIPALRIVSQMFGQTVYSDEEIIKYIPTLTNIVKELNNKWIEQINYLGKELKYNAEYNFETITGHPDVVTETSILDIKNSASFKGICKESCLQILAYYALHQKLYQENKVKYIGFILPMQREIRTFCMEGWDSSFFLNELLKVSDRIINPPELQIVTLRGTNLAVRMGQDLFIHYNVGNHVSKGGNIVNALSNWISTHTEGQYANIVGIVNGLTKIPPLQMFLRSPQGRGQSADINVNILSIADIIIKNKLKFFVHAAYIINLCAGIDWAQKSLEEDLMQTARIGGSGVVVHTGAANTGKSVEESLNIMENMVRKALVYATSECKLLLETPCAEGNDVCYLLQDLYNFYSRFSLEERSKLGLCVDTAHVHGAGYNPVYFITEWLKHNIVPIVLVHYNDSAVCCGSHVDRHAYPGHGYIGYETMLAVATICNNHGIPMVHE